MRESRYEVRETNIQQGMSMSVTTVPIQPIKKGSLTKYWVGIALLLAAAVALALWGTQTIRTDHASDDQFLAENAANKDVVTTKSGLQMQTVREGEGKSPTDADIALIGYKGTLRDGTVFDQNPQAPMPVAGVVPGFSEALKRMQKGGKYKIWIPGKLGYGENPPPNPQTGQPVLPANATLIFEVEMLDFRSQAEVEAMQKQAEKERGSQGGPQGGPQGAPQGLPPELQAQLEQQMRAQGQ
jgi:FKBP-type peptidyl-prolyl cis-trans isomerase FkpA